MKKKIAFFGNSKFSIFNFRKELVIDFLRDHEVSVIYPSGLEIDKGSEIIEGVTEIPINFKPKSTNLFSEIKLLYAIYKIMKNNKFDVVLTFTIKPNLYVAFISYLVKLKQVANITGFGRYKALF